MFAVVIFYETNELSVVPINWLQYNEKKCICFWPLYTTDLKINKAVQSAEPPKSSWIRFFVRVLQSYSKLILHAFNGSECPN